MILIGATFRTFPAVVSTRFAPPVELVHRAVPTTSPLTAAGPEVTLNVALTLAQNLELENLALLRRDGALLTQVDHGDRLAEMQTALANAATSGVYAVSHYDFDKMDVRLLVPFGAQTGLSLGFRGTGNVTVDTYDSTGRKLGSSSPEPFDQVFAVRRALGDRWLNVGVFEDDPPAG